MDIWLSLHLGILPSFYIQLANSCLFDGKMETRALVGVHVDLGDIYVFKCFAYENFAWLLGLPWLCLNSMAPCLCDCTWLLPGEAGFELIRWAKWYGSMGSCLVRRVETSLFGPVEVPEGLLKDLLFLNPSQPASADPICWQRRPSVFALC